MDKKTVDIDFVTNEYNNEKVDRAYKALSEHQKDVETYDTYVKYIDNTIPSSLDAIKAQAKAQKNNDETQL